MGSMGYVDSECCVLTGKVHITSCTVPLASASTNAYPHGHTCRPFQMCRNTCTKFTPRFFPDVAAEVYRCTAAHVLRSRIKQRAPTTTYLLTQHTFREISRERQDQERRTIMPWLEPVLLAGYASLVISWAGKTTSTRRDQRKSSCSLWLRACTMAQRLKTGVQGFPSSNDSASKVVRVLQDIDRRLSDDACGFTVLIV